MPTDLIAYFSMEIALASEIPTYAGGLGVLAGDTLRSAADMGLPMVAVTLLYRKGYFRQVLDANGHQTEKDVVWVPEQFLVRMPTEVEVTVLGRTVRVGLWRYLVAGCDGHQIPVYLLDTDLEGNHEEDRRITDHLYAGEERHRLTQEAVLGLGGRRMLEALGLRPTRYHMNEGHSSLLAVDLLRKLCDEARAASGSSDSHQLEACIARVREACVFTTHTPIPAGHDRFSRALAEEVFGAQQVAEVAQVPRILASELNMSTVGLELSGFVNGVSLRHAEVTRGMFPGHTIHAVTNGVHSATWTSPFMQAVFDRHIPSWRRHGHALRGAQRIPTAEIVAAHRAAKRALVEELNTLGDHNLDPDRFTIGFARRVTSYKRINLLLRDVRRLREIASRWGSLQIVFSGKAHPRDLEGKRLIEAVFRQQEALLPYVRMVFVPGYDMRLCGKIVAGVDLWLNTPTPPLEASGTSGMKAVHNGVPNLSVRDGWWCEGFVAGHTGWVIEPPGEGDGGVDDRDADHLYKILDHEVLPMYVGNQHRWGEVMRDCIALAASYFNSQRMLEEYMGRAYGLKLAGR
ncbi:MAG: alpha-glucan family phosphorylase [Myxococcales bacterium]|nr:alpha-glucan family phosphorylase [Myxococcales bacterium]